MRKNYIMYFDETNNCRKVSFNEEGFNDFSDKKIFILGGLAFKNKEANERFAKDFYSNRKNLEIDIIGEELKFKNFFAGKTNYKDVFSSTKLTKFLNFLLNEDVYIHFLALDCFYYSIVDIIDSIEYKKCVEAIDEDSELKNELYDILKKEMKRFLKLAYDFHYPDIALDRLDEFYLKLSEIVRSYNYKLADILLQEKSEISFVAENLGVYDKKTKRFKTINDFLPLYVKENFKNSVLIFDKEDFIQAIIKKLKGMDELFKNHQFIDSKEYLEIQISDIVVGVLKVYFDAIRNDEVEIKNKNVVLINKLLYKSEIENMYFLHFTFPREFRFKIMKIFHQINYSFSLLNYLFTYTQHM